jgi:hypothetical protein
MLRNREELVRRLSGKPLARAVRWYDPGVLVRVGIRDAVSAVFGEYADQRLMQAATDPAKDKETLTKRYDCRAEPLKSCVVYPSNECWVDYIADVGDGFGPTFGMATLLAAEELLLNGEKLPAGRILILGGDQCYPQATHEEYEERFVLPYATALPPLDEENKSKERLLFALPGNHDWYDGLGAFDNLFCQNRDHLLGRGNGRGIGGWRCQQHRSYWAIQLPYNWWLWGVDIQFSKHLDAAQENYFRAVVDSMGEGLHNVVLCIAEPHWLNSEFEGIDTVDSLHTIVRIALKKTKEETGQRVKNREVRVRAVLAGDWHHYSHYRLNELYDPEAKKADVQGKRPWTWPKNNTPEPALKDQGIHLITAGGGGAFLHSTTDLRRSVKVSWGVRPENPHGAEQHAGASREARLRPRRFMGNASMIACYPSRWRSALLSLKNLAFPFRNWRFSLVIGALYWIMTWQYHVVAKNTRDLFWLRDEIANVDYATIHSLSNKMLLALPQVAAENIFYFVLLLALWAGLAWYVTVSEKRTPLFAFLARVFVGSLHSLAHLKAMFFVFAVCMAINMDNGISGSLYPFEAVALGGLLGGFIFGTYWVLAGLIARMHTGDAFGALGIRNYKNFLRMKFDEHSLTIYPIGVDKLPSTKSCNKELKKNPPEHKSHDGSPLLKIKRGLKPFLIQGWDRVKEEKVGPIVIPRIPHAASRNAVERVKVAAE